jgi:hypothetical protein
MDNMILILQYALIPLIVSAPALVVLLAIKIITLPFRRIKRNEENANASNSTTALQLRVHRSPYSQNVSKETHKGRGVGRRYVDIHRESI